MPQEQGYERRVGSVTPAALPQASAAAFGAGIGQSVSELGDTLHRRDVREYQIERQQTADSEAADAAVKMAEARQRLDAARDQARSMPSAGAADHVKIMEATFDREVSGIGDGITEDRVRRSVTSQLADYRSNFVSGEHSWQTVYVAKKSATDMGVLLDHSSARLFTSTDPAAYDQETKAVDDALDSAPGFSVDAREAYRRVAHGTLATTQIGRMKPEAAIVAIDAGVFNDVLDGKQLEHLRYGAEAKQRMAAGQQKALDAAALAETKKKLAVRRAELETGAGTPQDWGTLAQQYEAAGEGAQAVAARANGTEMMAGLVHKGDNVATLNTQISALTAKQSSAGLSPAEASTLKGITTLRNQKAQRLSEPGGSLLEWEYSTGRTLPPLNPGDPASMRLRGQQAATAAQAAGRPNAIEPFKPTELPAMKDLMEKGAGGRTQVLQALAGFGDARVIDGAAKQISDSGDGAFRIAARLLSYPAGLPVANAIVRGDEIRSKQPWTALEQKTARDDFFKWYGPVLRGGNIDPQYANDLLDGALSFYASRANGGGYVAKRFAEATETVLGRNGKHGGLARVPGMGIVIAPPTMAPEEMMTRFAKAEEPDYRAAAGGRKPVHSDGSPLVRRELRTMLQVRLGDGRYGFRGGPGGALLNDDRGDIYAVDLHRLPAR